MLFDHKFNERLLSFARNIAAITFITGLSIVIIVRANTKKDIEVWDHLLLNSVGLIVLLWSLYLVIANIHVLRHDFKIYLESCVDAVSNEQSLKIQPIKIQHKNSTSQMTYYLIKTSKVNLLTFSFRYIFICLIGFSFIIIWYIGALEIAERIALSFGFNETM